MLKVTSIAPIPNHTQSARHISLTGRQEVTIQTGYSLWSFERVSKWRHIKACAVDWVNRHKPGIDPSSVHVGIVEEKVALEQVFLRVFQFSPDSTIPPLFQFFPDSAIPPILQFSSYSNISLVFQFSSYGNIPLVFQFSSYSNIPLVFQFSSYSNIPLVFQISS